MQGYANITIGGRIPADHVDLLIQHFRYECLISGEEIGILELVADSDGLIYFEDDYAHNGEFVNLEAFMELNDIAYDRYSSQVYEFNACSKRFRPGSEARVIVLNSDGKPVLTSTEIKRLVNNSCGDLKHFQKTARQEMGLDIPKLDPVEIDGLLSSKAAVILSEDELKKLNMDGRTECACCGQGLLEPYAGIKYCLTCEGGA